MTRKATTTASKLAACLVLALAPVGMVLAAAKHAPAPRPPAAATPATAPADVPTGPAQISGATADELRRLVDEHALSELRRTANGSYAASLLFDADHLVYYVVLSHNAEYWRVIKSDVVADAERVYRTFAQQTEQLAQTDIDTVRLEAGRKYGEKLLNLNQQRLAKLQEDAQHRQQQATQVAAMQQQAKAQATALSSDLRSTRSQLEQVQQNIRTLEAQQADPLLNLPEAPAPTTAPAPVTTPEPARQP
jgi:hypothetical protein